MKTILLKYGLPALGVLLIIWFIINRWEHVKQEIFDSGVSVGREEIQAKWDRVESIKKDLALADNTEQRKLENLRQSKAMEASNGSKKRELALRDAVGSLAAERDGLRRDFEDSRQARVGSSGNEAGQPSCQAQSKRITALEEVFEQCVGRYSGLAEKADRHASDALMYDEAWPVK